MKKFSAIIAAPVWMAAALQAQTNAPSGGSTPPPAKTPASSTPAAAKPANPTPAPAPAVAPGEAASTPAASPGAKPPKPRSRVISLAPIIYKAPKSAQASSGEDGDGGSRGGGTKLASLYVLAPKHTGLTTRAQPSLFWYQSGPAPTRFELTLIEPKKPKPLLKVIAEKADQPGFHRISLRRYNVTLDPNITYRWSVALVPNPTSRSQDIIAIGRIRRVEPNAKLAASLSHAQSLEKAALFAENGIWYDAWECVSEELNASVEAQKNWHARATLLEQVGLEVIARGEGR